MPVRTVRKQRGGIKHVRVAGAAGHDGEGRDSGEQVVRVQIPAVPLTRYETRDSDFALLRLDRRLRNGDDQSSHFWGGCDLIDIKASRRARGPQEALDVFAYYPCTPEVTSSDACNARD